MAAVAEGQRGRSFTPYLLVAPGVLYLLVFFVVPLFSLAQTSVEPNSVSGIERSGLSTFGFALTTYGEQFLRSLRFAALATIAALIIGYPLAYVIAFKGGRFKNLLLALVVLPFFTTYLIRTLAWKTLLADQGFVVEALRGVGILSSSGRLLFNDWAVIGALTYNFLPFMVLPIYVSLEKIDRRLVEAGTDLYASGSRTFRKVVFPLSLPGLFAGSLLTFIPAAGDFINAKLLGGVQQTMIGNVIQGQFLEVRNYPLAAAMSFVVMAVILIIVLVYARVLGTEDLT